MFKELIKESLIEILPANKKGFRQMDYTLVNVYKYVFGGNKRPNVISEIHEDLLH